MFIISGPLYKTLLFENQSFNKDRNRRKQELDYLVVPVPTISVPKHHRKLKITLQDYLISLLLVHPYHIYLVFMTRFYWLARILIFCTLFEVHCCWYAASVYFKKISGLSSKASGSKSALCVDKVSGNMLNSKDQFLFHTCLLDLKFDENNCLINAIGYLPIGENSLRVKFNQTYGKRPLALKLTLCQIHTNRLVLHKLFKYQLRFNDTKWNNVSKSETNNQLSFSYKLACPPDYYGPTCGKSCKARNEIRHYTCGNNGEKICLEGWYGAQCDRQCSCIKQDPPTGKCSSNGRCDCYKGWAGLNCAIDMGLCYTRKCKNGGTCNKINGQCICPPTHGGKYCETPLLKPSSSIITITLTRAVQFNQTRISPSQTSYKPDSFSAVIQPTSSVSLIYSSLTRSTVIPYSSLEAMSSKNGELSSLSIEPSTSLVVACSTLVITSLPPTSIPTNSSKRNESSDTGTIIAVISVTIFLSLALTMFLFWLVWRRKRLQRRKSQVSNIITMTTDDEPDTISRPSTFSSTRSVSPLINYLYEKDSLPSPQDPPDLEVFSVLDKPVVEEKEEDKKKYALKEIDRICMEALNGPSSSRSKKTDESTSNGRIQRTDMQANCIDEQLICCDKRLRNDYSCNCSSSGYESGSSTPLSSQSGSASSSRLPPSRLDKRLHGCSSSVSSSSTSSGDRRRNNNNNNSSSTQTLSSQSSSLHNECFEEDDELIHNRQTKHHVQFEGLPNFILYREDTNV